MKFIMLLLILIVTEMEEEVDDDDEENHDNAIIPSNVKRYYNTYSPQKKYLEYLF